MSWEVPSRHNLQVTKWCNKLLFRKNYKTLSNFIWTLITELLKSRLIYSGIQCLLLQIMQNKSNFGKQPQTPRNNNNRSTSDKKSDEWMCASCNTSNFSTRGTCRKCKNARNTQILVESEVSHLHAILSWYSRKILHLLLKKPKNEKRSLIDLFSIW